MLLRLAVRCRDVVPSGGAVPWKLGVHPHAACMHSTHTHAHSVRLACHPTCTSLAMVCAVACAASLSAVTVRSWASMSWARACAFSAPAVSVCAGQKGKQHQVTSCHVMSSQTGVTAGGRITAEQMGGGVSLGSYTGIRHVAARQYRG